ncbi:hypothetical protein IT570_01610 [Candidatus Sumerlaeota bacterium]|nr:hypothetical protein [Candidatus Sumerlaeota bacterium]
MTVLKTSCGALIMCLVAGIGNPGTGAPAPADDASRRMIKAVAASDTGILPPGAPGARYQAQEGPIMACGDTTLQAILVTPTVVVGEPVLFRLVIRKADRNRPTVEFRSRLAYGTDLRAYIIPQHGRPYEYVGTQVGSQIPTGVVTLDRFNSYRIDYRIAMDKETVSGAAFEQPGVYGLRITHACAVGDEPVVIGQFSINVKAAEGDDAKALGFLNEYELFECLQVRSAKYALGAKKMTPEQVALFQRIVDQAPKAALRPYAMQVIAEYDIENNDVAKAAQVLGGVIDEYPGTIPAEESTMRLISLLHTNDKLEEARTLFLKAWQDPVLSQLMLPGSPNWKRYVAGFDQVTTARQWSLYDQPDKDPRMVGPSGGPRVTLMPEAIEDLRSLGGFQFTGASEVVGPDGQPIDLTKLGGVAPAAPK